MLGEKRTAGSDVVATGAREALAETEMAPTVEAATSGVMSSRRPAEDVELASTAAVPMSVTASTEDAVHVSNDLPELTGADRYEAGPQIGSGGMGEVVLQIDRNIGRAVAKKMLHPEMHKAVALQRFVREARVQGQLEHPAVVPVHDFGVDADGRLFFSMKRIRGQTLGQILDRLAARDHDFEARFSRHKLLSAFVQVCLAIEYAHKRGVIHRDLKPSNVMLGDFGEVYVLDWGLAKLTTRADASPEGRVAAVTVPPRADEPRLSNPEMTTDGDFLGTPLYMAPEQLLGRHAAVDERADVFGLGAILFEILALEPYRRGTTMAALFAEAEETAPVERASSRAEDIPADLDELCASALARTAAQRLGSARALADAVERHLQGDRDMVARRVQAAELLDHARSRLSAPEGARATELVLAIREVLKALALSPDDAVAQRLLVSLMLEGSGDLSPEAQAAFRAGEADVRRQGVSLGLGGYLGWLATVPFALLAGVRSWGLFTALIVLTIVCVVVCVMFLRKRSASVGVTRFRTLTLAVVSAVIVAMASAWLGPFVIVPLGACCGMVVFTAYLTPEESRAPFVVWLLAIIVPFVLELFHLVPPAYTFANGEIILHPRLLNFPEGPTMTFIVYSAVTFVAVLGYFVGRLRKKQRDAEQRLFGQAWLLRHLFPAEESAEADPKA